MKESLEQRVRPLRVLFVDDDEDWANAQAEFLRSNLGALVDYAMYPDAASERVEQVAYDVVVVDIWFGEDKQRGDEWLLKNYSNFLHAIKIVFTADETRGGHWQALREARVHVLRKLTHERRFQELAKELYCRISRPLSTPNLSISATPEEAGMLLSSTWHPTMAPTLSVVLGGEQTIETSLATPDLSTSDGSYSSAVFLIAELALLAVAATLALGLTMQVAIMTFVGVSVSISIWYLLRTSRSPGYNVVQRCAVLMAAVVLLAELVLLVGALVSKRGAS